MSKPNKKADPSQLIEGVLKALPSVTSHPTVRALYQRQSDLSAELTAAELKRKQLEADMAKSGLSPNRSPLEAEAARLASGGGVNDTKLLGMKSEMESTVERINTLRRAVELVTQQITSATAEAQREYTPQVRELGIPFIKRTVEALFTAALFNVEVQKLHEGVRRLGLSPYALASVLPPNPFLGTFIGHGGDSVARSVRNLLTRFVSAGVFSADEAAEWNAKFRAE